MKYRNTKDLFQTGQKTKLNLIIGRFMPVFILLVLLFDSGVHAQNPYDFCESAYEIEHPGKWCSKSGQFSTFEATNSGSDIATCFANFGKDVWFKFTAVGTILKVSVKGVGSGKEMMKQPEFVLFSGDCSGQISLIGCSRSRKGKRFTSLRREHIVPGQTYLISVQDANQEAGQFQICVTNYSPKLVTKPNRKKPKNLIQELSHQVRTGEEFSVEQLHFDANSYEIKSSFLPVLFELIHYLKSNPSVVIEVGGHTNSHCDDVYCQELSKKRAKAIAEFIMDKGVPESQITYQGYGKTKPLYHGQSKAYQAKNQRVMIKVLKTR